MCHLQVWQAWARLESDRQLWQSRTAQHTTHMPGGSYLMLCGVVKSAPLNCHRFVFISVLILVAVDLHLVAYFAHQRVRTLSQPEVYQPALSQQALHLQSFSLLIACIWALCLPESEPKAPHSVTVLIDVRRCSDRNSLDEAPSMLNIALFSLFIVQTFAAVWVFPGLLWEKSCWIWKEDTVDVSWRSVWTGRWGTLTVAVPSVVETCSHAHHDKTRDSCSDSGNKD